ncbi:MAG: hypothetical protein AB7O21_17630 [Gammaproteobacteria bacterium]
MFIITSLPDVKTGGRAAVARPSIEDVPVAVCAGRQVYLLSRRDGRRRHG